jgi:hypothetical protein
MIDFPDYGYVQNNVQLLDAGGIASGELGGPFDIIDRPGLRYGVSYSTPTLNMKKAQEFQAYLERGLRDYVSYLWPLDFRPLSVTSSNAHVNGLTPAGSTVVLAGLPGGYALKRGQPLSFTNGSFWSIHRVVDPVHADGTGAVTVEVFPWTRFTLPNASLVEITKPRIRGVLTWDGASQPSFGGRSFSFGIKEAR